jgi:hypothetical protein
MTTTLQATHRGTCQACGRAQAYYKGAIAKHGYTVQWGYFHGVCRGAEALPLEQDKSITEATIKYLLETHAPQADKLAADLRSGAVEPQFYNSEYDRVKCKTVKTACTRAELKFQCYETQDAVAERQIAAAVLNAEGDARHARSHAAMLEKLIAARHGQPLMPIIGKRQLAVGDRVNRGSAKKPVITEVIELRYQRASGCGPYMNGQHLLHAVLKYDNGNTYAVPVRRIRTSSIVEGGAA